MLTPAASATAPAMRPADTSPFLFGVRTVTPPGEPAARWLGNVMTPAGVVDVGPPRSPDGAVAGGASVLLDELSTTPAPPTDRIDRPAPRWSSSPGR